MTDLAELSARARRGALTDAEDQQLGLLLAGSLEARLAHRAGCEFDREDSVVPGDDALAARVTARVLASVGPAVARRRLGHRLAVGAVLVTVAAAAGPVLTRHWGGSSAPAPTSAQPAERQPARVARRPAQAPPQGSVPPVTTLSSQPPAATRHRPSASPPASASDPAALFAEASRARRQGQTARAMDLYQELQRRYPESAEAHAADIALGVLYSGGSPAVALKHFDRYLESAGPLTPEALWGRAQALDALGRTEQARDSWRALLARYPRSAYANAARAKLGLDR